MRTPVRSLACLLLLAVAGAACADDLASGFRTPPVSAWPQVWWHWVSGNVTREGITADLEAMKRAGIGGGTIANIPFGSEGAAPFMTPAWREMVKHATREAARLGLELGFFNCEGWSSSGGPWVTPDRAMQTLVWSERTASGPGRATVRLAQPVTRLGFYRDAAVVAFPTPAAERAHPVRDLAPVLATAAGPCANPAFLTDGDPATFLEVPSDASGNGYLQATFAQPLTISGFRLTPGPDWTRDDMELLVSDDGTVFRSVGKYPMPLSFLDAGVEWQVAPTFAPVTARCFRFAFHLSRGRTFQADATRSTVSELELVTNAEPRAIPAGAVVDLTGKMDASGQVTWDVPAGDWTIVRLGHTPIGKRNHPVTKWGEGLECDKLSKEALRRHCEAFVDKVIADAGPLAGKTLAYSLIDSYECGEQNWTAAMPAEFRRLRGYDLTPWLPTLTGRTVGSPDLTKRFQDDFRRTIADLWDENYYGTFTALLHARGLKSSAEAYGNGTFDNLRAGGVSDMPMTEFWHGSLDDGGLARQAASAAHVYGRPLVGAEAFTSGDMWNFDPWSMKLLGDWEYSHGVNRFYFHSYAGQPWVGDRKPGLAWGNGIHLTRNLTWWEPGRAWFAYLGRCQYLLQQGRSVADILSYAGEDGYTFYGDGRTMRTPPAGHDYDGLDRDMLLSGITVRDGMLAAPGGTRYRLLVLPDGRVMSPAVLRRLRDLVQAGAAIFGPRPERAFGLSGHPASDAEVKRLAAELWGDIDGAQTVAHRLGKGRVYWTGDRSRLQPVLDDLAVKPDFAYGADDSRLRWLHRQVGDAHLYFVSAQEVYPLEATCTFRVRGLQPELWDPETGHQVDAPVWKEEPDGRTTVPLHFEPGQALFVVFRRPVGQGDHLVSVSFRPAEQGETRRHTLEIRSAVYAAPDGFGAPLDMTAKVAGLVRGGALRLEATNTLAGTDPAPLHVKELRVEYVYDGTPGKVTVRENGVLRIPTARPEEYPPVLDLASIAAGASATAWQPGTLAARWASGRAVERRVTSPAETLKLDGPWDVRFQPRWGGPARVRFDTLADWTKRPEEGIRHYSGTAIYERTFDVPRGWTASGKRVVLDLGSLSCLAEVTLNGQRLGVLWKPPWRLDVTGRLRPGANRLEVAVTNQWANRLIGDAALPADKRVATTTHNPYRPDSPLQESGLLGPVLLRAASSTTLR